MTAAFLLRRSRDNRNVPVGNFRELGNGVHRVDYEIQDSDSSIYQIYPGDENCTFYSLERGQMIIVYCVVDANAIRCAAHDMHDQYVYFEALPRTSSVLVVVARSVEESETLLSKMTEFKV